jgi:hypothetical protein
MIQEARTKTRLDARILLDLQKLRYEKEGNLSFIVIPAFFIFCKLPGIKRFSL